MQTLPVLPTPVLDGRDAGLFPGVALGFVTRGEVLVPLQRGDMVRETAPGKVASYWRVIPQFGRVWREQADGEWSRAAFPLMLVNDTENHAHQGLATFLYKGGTVSSLRVQFVQQTAPYLLSPHSVLWGSIPATVSSVAAADIDTARREAAAELAARLPTRPLADLRTRLPDGTLEALAVLSCPSGRAGLGLVHEGTLYYEAAPTAYGDYPYPLEMRYGVRSVMKAVAPPLALLRLAKVYGPYVLNLRIGDYVPGLDPKWNRIRFIDAANMATGFGGTGTFKTNPNDDGDGYLEGDYDGWYTAHSHADKIARINASLRPYPWEPGTVIAVSRAGSLPARHRDRPLPEIRARPDRRRVADCCRTRCCDRSALRTPPRSALANPASVTVPPGSTPATTRHWTTWRRSRCCTRTKAVTVASRSCIAN